MKKFFVCLAVLFALMCICVYKKQPVQTTIKFSSWGSQSEAAILKEIINAYELNNKNIKVDLIHIPQNYFQKLHLLFASGLEPDIVFINNQNIQMYLEANLLEDLSTLVQNNKSDFFEEALDCFTKNGKLYAIPRDISTLVLYYNKDILQKDNLRLSSLNDILLIGKQLKGKNIFAINSEENPLFWMYYLASGGGGALSGKSQHIIINSKNSIKMLQFCSDLVNKYHYAPSRAEIGSMTTAQMFINGKLAMYLGGRWMTPKFRETIKFNWDITEFPVSDGNKLYIDSSGWALSKNSKHKKEAVDFINYLSSEINSEKFAEEGLIIPARKSAALKIIQSEQNQNPANSYIFIDMIKNTVPTPVCGNYRQINDILEEKARSIFYSNKPPQEAFDKKTIEKLERLL